MFSGPMNSDYLMDSDFGKIRVNVNAVHGALHSIGKTLCAQDS